MILPEWSTICILEGYQVKLTYWPRPMKEKPTEENNTLFLADRY